MTRLQFLSLIAGAITAPFIAKKAKAEEKDFDFKAYLKRNPTVSLMFMDADKTNHAIEFEAVNVPELRPKQVLDLWEKSGGFMLYNSDQYRGIAIPKNWN